MYRLSQLAVCSLLSLFMFTPALAIEITFKGLQQKGKGTEIVTWWGEKPQKPEVEDIRQQQIKINIPDEFVQKTGSGHIDLLSSLEAWRKGTPKGNGYPYTDKDNTQYFPIYKHKPQPGEDKSLPLNAKMTEYIALPKILDQAKDRPNLRFQASNNKTVSLVKNGLIEDIQKMKRTGGPVNCKKSSRLGARGPWTPAECFICNCANETGSTESHRGKVAVNRVVLRRVVSKNFPNSICDVVLFKNKNKGKVQAAFSWTYSSGKYQRFKTLPSKDPGSLKLLNQCVDAGIEALKSGPGAFDHYYNPRAANPSWRKKFKKTKKIGNHIFLNKFGLDHKYDRALEQELQSTGGEIIRPIQSPQPPKGKQDYDTVF